MTAQRRELMQVPGTKQKVLGQGPAKAEASPTALPAKPADARSSAKPPAAEPKVLLGVARPK